MRIAVSAHAPMRRADVLVVGGGIAGLSAAYFATRAGRDVTLVDEGLHRASDLPIALINPLRGHTGRLVARGVEGMQATFALIETLRDAGHVIAAARGLFRPLVDVAAAASQHAYWTERIAGQLAFDWHDVAPSTLGLVDAVPALHLRDAGWVAAPDLLGALQRESGATVVVARVVRLAPDGRGGGTARLSDGTTVAAKAVLWCGGAWGAAGLDESTTGDASYKPGSLIVADVELTREPMSFGLYAVPSAGLVDATRRPSTVIGPTREGSCDAFPDGPVPDAAIAHLADRIARVFSTTGPVRPVWRGVRLTRMSTAASTSLSGSATLTALGSRGFLMAPLLAAEWARSL